MTTLTIALPDKLAEEAKNAGLLAPDALEAILRENLHRGALVFVRQTWLAGALKELAGLDGEITEEGFPEVGSATKQEAKRIITALASEPVVPMIYPTQDGEIAIDFRSPSAPSAVLIELSNDGQGACFSCIGGKSRRARYQDSSDLPDEFVRTQLRALQAAEDL